MINIIDIYKSFSGKQILRGVNLDVREAENLVIIGRSGCGKSILLKTVAALIEPDRGRIIIDQVDLLSLSRKEMRKIRPRIAMVFQGAALFDSLNVRENVGFYLYEHTKVPHAEIESKVKEKLRMVGLVGIEEMFPSELSGGMRKRVAIARALCNEPSIILYDEPTTGLDPITADSINQLISSLRDQLKVTSIIVTHDMISAYKISDRIAMLYEGKIICLGRPEEIKNTDNPIVRQFITGQSAGPITDLDGKFMARNGQEVEKGNS